MITNDLVKVACEYYKQNNSLKEIAELLEKNYNFKININTLGYHLKKSGLKLRSKIKAIVLRKRKHINISRLLENYNSKVPIRELSRNLKISRDTIRKILVENGIDIMDSRSAQLATGYIKEKKKFELSPQEKAYLYALVMGDLTPVRKSNYTLKLITHSTHRTFMDLLQRTFEEYGITNYKETKNQNMYRFQSHLDLESFSFLLDSKSEILPSWIDSNNFYDFLAGFIDSDGSVIIRKTDKWFQYVIRFFGQNLDLLLEIKKNLEDLGYNLSIHKNHKIGDKRYNNGVLFKYNKDYYVLETFKKNQTLDLLNKIPIRHPEKIAKRELIFKIENQGNVHWKDVEKEVKELKSKIKQTVLQKTVL